MKGASPLLNPFCILIPALTNWDGGSITVTIRIYLGTPYLNWLVLVTWSIRNLCKVILDASSSESASYVP